MSKKPHNVLVLEALANTSRVRLVDALVAGPASGEELAGRLELSPSTVSHHLSKLVGAGLVTKRRQQYYQLYEIAEGWMDTTLGELLVGESSERWQQERRARAARAKVLKVFFDGQLLMKMPRQWRKQEVVLDVFAADFERGREYAEREVDAVIHRRFADHCLIRRLLVERGTLARKDGRYRLVAGGDGAPRRSGPGSTSAGHRGRSRQAGIYRITHRASGRFLLGSSLDVQSRLNRHRFELGVGSDRTQTLQADWQTFGAEAFEFDIPETVAESAPEGGDVETALETLEATWIERLAPFDGGGYNQRRSLRV